MTISVSRLRITTITQLEALPDQAVIYTHDNTVWQHGVGAMSSGAVNERLGTMSWNAKQLWVTFGSHQIEHTTGIKLPAYLLDDGL